MAESTNVENGERPKKSDRKIYVLWLIMIGILIVKDIDLIISHSVSGGSLMELEMVITYILFFMKVVSFMISGALLYGAKKNPRIRNVNNEECLTRDRNSRE
ncbi:hypothetical protein PENTCL1PPCAC_4036 [Pristionchus entomophagus]|uniref:Uncharacterized protein n=1 Tax=Pristionchus entomophagus TaxID=358040 RepID=A0AAV5SQK5_9BILA|nr:hypothetical protein PENTCL1PPCAC_4036 [Pristionchus entomophagus]